MISMKMRNDILNALYGKFGNGGTALIPTSILSNFIPPEVEPEQPQTVPQTISMIMLIEGQRLQSVVAKPVVVTKAMTWKTALLKHSPKLEKVPEKKRLAVTRNMQQANTSK